MLTALVLVITACGDDDPSNSTPAPLFTRAPETATATITSTPTASATPAVVVTPHAVVTASPDEPVTTTAYIPTTELPLAVMTAADGSEHVLPIEVPDQSEYTIGLSGRLELGERGMLFWYAQPTLQNFWMFNTHYDLSIAFVDGDATIVDILLLEAESLQTRGPDEAYRFAIEAPAGWFDARGIGPGDQAVLDFELPDFLRD